MTHIKPKFIRYIPIRLPIIDIEEIALFNHLGQPIQLRGQQLSITLHFNLT